MLVQVMGHRGMLGRAVLVALITHGDEFVTSHCRLEDITANDIHAPIVINCAGIVKQREESASDFILSNSYGPQRLAEECDRADARLIHVSTDCVFERSGPHAESDVPDPHGIYALSKLCGEVTREPHLTIRTSFIGRDAGLLHTMMHSESITASHRLLWSGHLVNTVAKVIVGLAEREDITGLLHVPGEALSRYGLVMLLKEAYNLPIEVKRDDSYSADRRLISLRWDALGLPKLPSLSEQLRESH